MLPIKNTCKSTKRECTRVHISHQKQNMWSADCLHSDKVKLMAVPKVCQINVSRKKLIFIAFKINMLFSLCSFGRKHDLCYSFSLYLAGQKAETALCCELQIVSELSSQSHARRLIKKNQIQKTEDLDVMGISRFRSLTNYLEVAGFR